MRMKCTLNGNNARTLAKAIQSLSKFGAELFLEADQNGLMLRTVNATRSAVGSFKFRKIFFEHYFVDPEAENCCKMTMKACVSKFRHMKLVEHLEIRLSDDELKFEMEMKCRHEQTRKIVISIIDQENITSSIPAQQFPNKISAYYKIFNEISSSFNATVDEITLDVNETTLTAKNYVEGARVTERFMRSQLKLTASEMETYNIGYPTAITFCLKEFKAFLSFAEAIDAKLILEFEAAGSPLFIRMQHMDQLDCVVVLSTLSPEDVTISNDLRHSQSMDSSTLTVNMSQKRKMASNSSTGLKEPAPKKRSHADETTLSNDSELFQFAAVDNETSDSNLSDINIGVPVSDNVSVQFYDTDIRAQQNPIDELDESIPQSPGQRRTLRTIFSRCFEATYFPDEPSPNSQVFAPNSDTDD